MDAANTPVAKTKQATPSTTKNAETLADSANETQQESQQESSGIPDSEIYLATLQFIDGNISIGMPVNITNNSGYDNQPYFLPDSNTILFTSRRGSEASQLEQSDIYAYTISSESVSRMTDTPESEYSPTLTPNGESISVVRVEIDSTQRLWEFPIQPSIVTNDQFSVVFPEVKRVGYHTWADANTAYVFLVDPNPAGERHTLEVVARNSGKSRQIASTIGRSLVMQPETDHLVFVDKSDSKNWLIKTYNPTTTLAVEMLNALNGSEDMAWLDKENLLMASGNEIYLNTSENGYGENWQLVSGNSLHDLPGTISRLAVSPDLQWLALVVSK